MKHDWEPVDNQGYAMECVGCGAYISIESPVWDEKIDADCPKTTTHDKEIKDQFGGDEMTLDSIIASAPDNFVIRDALARCFEVVQEHKHIVCSCSGGGATVM